MDFRKVGFWQLVILAFLLNFIVQALHESGHWLICEVLGKDPVWGFNQLLHIWGETPVNQNEWVTIIAPDGEKGWLHLASSLNRAELAAMLAAGPLASVFGVIFGLCLAHRNRIPSAKLMGLVMAFIGSLLMSVYYLRSFSSTGGDEYFLAANLGIAKYIIDIPPGLIFIFSFILVMMALHDWKTRLKWFGAIILGSIPAGLFIMKANALVLDQVNHGNPFFHSFLGWSLPVFIVNVIVCVLLWILWKRINLDYNSKKEENN